MLAPRYHQLLDQPVAREQALALLDRVGLLAHATNTPAALRRPAAARGDRPGAGAETGHHAV
jgi:ABC-type polar amino acid transport system ATPase subunit